MLDDEFEVFGAGGVGFGVVLQRVYEGFGEADGVVADEERLECVNCG